MNRKKIKIIISIISTLGIIAWMITDFFGGMYIYFLSYPFAILLTILLYIYSFTDTIISLVKRGLNQNIINVTFHGLVVLAVILTNIMQSEILKSKRILTATLKDDLFYYTLVFRENGNCENEISGMFGYHKIFNGNYIFRGDTILFTKIPYDKDFIPDTILIDPKEKAIFINKDSMGNFITTKEWLNHFEINENIR